METQQRTFEEINQWGQVIPSEKFVALDIYTRCIEAINQHFQYPSFFSALIGYLIFFSTDHWSSAQKAALKNPGLVQCLQEQAESIILLGWNTKNTNPSVGIAQLDTLVKTLATMSHMALVGSSQCGEEINEISSNICSILENKWIKESFVRFQINSRKHQWSAEIIHCFIKMSKNNFSNFNNISSSLVTLVYKRYSSLLATFGDFKLNMTKFQRLLMFGALKGTSYESLKAQLAWNTGSLNPSALIDPFNVGALPVVNLYTVVNSAGTFVHKKREALRFKDVSDNLMKFARNEDVAHLFFMTLLFNSDETRHFQNQYQYLLVKKLAENRGYWGTDSGDSALCLLENLFGEYITLADRFFNIHLMPRRVLKSIMPRTDVTKASEDKLLAIENQEQS